MNLLMNDFYLRFPAYLEQVFLESPGDHVYLEVPVVLC